MRGVIVIEVDTADALELAGEFGRAMTQAREQIVFPAGYKMKAYAAINEDAEMVLDVFRTPELGGGRHVVVITTKPDYDSEWVIEHSLLCRRTHKMSACPWIADLYTLNAEGGLPPDGRYELSHNPTLEGIDGIVLSPAPLDTFTEH